MARPADLWDYLQPQDGWSESLVDEAYKLLQADYLPTSDIGIIALNNMRYLHFLTGQIDGLWTVEPLGLLAPYPLSTGCSGSFGAFDLAINQETGDILFVAVYGTTGTVSVLMRKDNVWSLTSRVLWQAAWGVDIGMYGMVKARWVGCGRPAVEVFSNSSAIKEGKGWYLIEWR